MKFKSQTILIVVNLLLTTPNAWSACECDTVPPGKSIIHDGCSAQTLCAAGKCQYTQDNGLPGYVGCKTKTKDKQALEGNEEVTYTQEEVEVIVDMLTDDRK